MHCSRSSSSIMRGFFTNDDKHKEIDTQIVKANAAVGEVYRSVLKNGTFQTLAFIFNWSLFHPDLWSWILANDKIPATVGQPRRVVWVDLFTYGSATWPECLKVVEASPVGYTRVKATKRRAKDHMTSLHLGPALVESLCEACRIVELKVAERSTVFVKPVHEVMLRSKSLCATNVVQESISNSSEFYLVGGAVVQDTFSMVFVLNGNIFSLASRDWTIYYHNQKLEVKVSGKSCENASEATTGKSSVLLENKVAFRKKNNCPRVSCN